MLSSSKIKSILSIDAPSFFHYCNLVTIPCNIVNEHVSNTLSCKLKLGSPNTKLKSSSCLQLIEVLTVVGVQVDFPGFRIKF